MKRSLSISLCLIFAATSFVSCEQVKGIFGDKKAAEEQKRLEEQKKMEEMAAQVAAKLAEQQKKEAEDKAKREQEIEAEVQKRLADMKAAPQPTATAQPMAAQPTTQPTTQPVTQPTTPPPATAQEQKPVEKVVERIIIKEKAPATPKTPAEQPAATARPTGYVRLYDDAGFTDRILTVRFGRDIGNMHYVSSDDGKSGFNDKASSVQYSVPPGWQAVLYENDNYSKRGYALKGSGSIPDLGYFGDKCSSLRWERTAQ